MMGATGSAGHFRENFHKKFLRFGFDSRHPEKIGVDRWEVGVGFQSQHSDLMGLSFQRKKENFNCDKCGFFVEGNGYTNHCPKCLWSKHIDVNPGDRGEICQSLMEPIGCILKAGKQVIIHRCVGCGIKRRVKAGTADNSAVLIGLPGKTS